MTLNLEQQKIQEDIFYKHTGIFWFPENLARVTVLFASDVCRYVDEAHNRVWNINHPDTEGTYEKLRACRKFILSLDGYDKILDFCKVQWERERFEDMNVEELLEELMRSEQVNWWQDREYYYALFEVIEDKLEQKGIDLWFDNFFEIWI